MLSHFIKAKTLVLVVLVALFAGLAWFSADYDTRGGALGPACPIKVYGRCYREQEVRRFLSYFEVSRNLLFFEFVQSLFGEDRLDNDPTDFVTNLIILRQEAERLGIEPTDEEAKEAIRTAPIFSIQTMINDEILESNILAPRGLTKADLVQIGKDYLCWRKLGDLLEAGNQPVPIELEKAYVQKYQQFTASLAEFKLEGFREKALITDEEIQKFFDENKEDLLSEEKRGITLIKFSPPAETEGMTNEQKAQQRLDYNNRVNEIYGTLAEDESMFAELAKGIAADPANKFPITLEEIAPFAMTSPPEALKEKADLLADLFSGARTIQAGTAVSVPFPQEDGSYLMFKLTQVVEPTGLTLDQAKEQIKTALTNKKANLLVNEAATDARAKMLEALEAGKPVAEAAKV
ncbi:MAG: SurA N-terminal domain-containing protein, partial [Verrucomicrobiae bacterium]|nr:SurA N-terminal domain-containing protein [Verrucomicrobiae bacterium]